jgi:hypothetical protein
MSSLIIRHLAYFGPDRKAALLNFEPGLNVICGASETGKSFIAESIDFMLGQEEPVRDIPQRAGYDRVRLAIETANSAPLTLDRSVQGGNYLAYEELLGDEQPRTEANTVRWKHAAARTDTLSYMLLSRLGFSGKILRRNAGGRTRTLSFRDIARLCVVTEEEIQRRGSPVLTGQFVNATSEYAAFKLFLTGTDDSALVAVGGNSAMRERDVGKVELLDQLIAELQVELDESGVKEEELKEQEERLSASLSEQAKNLQAAQAQLDILMTARAEAAALLRGIKSRLIEISEFEKRFTLLDHHYVTDLGRLRAISESGSLFLHLAIKPCPLCGALPGDQHLETECDGNAEAVVRAADAETSKIDRLRRELSDTLVSLATETSELNERLPLAKQNYDSFETQIREIVAPSVSEKRASYNDVVSKISDVRSSLDAIARLKNLLERRSVFEDLEDPSSGSKGAIKTHIPSSLLDEFAGEIQSILEDWEYPDASRVFFDETRRDIQIAGKPRGSTGKGLRAITHAAFTIGLMQFCRERGLPHPGFVVLDSPLLAYWKPEGDDDDLRGTSLKERFYRYLIGMGTDSQVIIIENEHPPSFVQENGAVTIFTKNPTAGRYGFFPQARAS